MSEDVREWGPEIRVDGVRPEWLEGDPKKVWASDRQGRWLDRSINAAFDNWSWGWIGTIRLPVDHSHYAAQEPRTAPSGGDVGAEVVERMIALVRAMTVRSKEDPYSWDRHGGSSRDYDEARAIVALLPEPVDALEEAKTTLDVYLAAYPKADDGDPVDRSGDDLLTFGHLRTILRALEKEAGR